MSMIIATVYAACMDVGELASSTYWMLVIGVNTPKEVLPIRVKLIHTCDSVLLLYQSSFILLY